MANWDDVASAFAEARSLFARAEDAVNIAAQSDHSRIAALRREVSEAKEVSKRSQHEVAAAKDAKEKAWSVQKQLKKRESRRKSSCKRRSVKKQGMQEPRRKLVGSEGA
eukprot:TRINITY_DN11219_c0_g2_i2.p1 TRINITY_DN11219_c0_g2~~TRINITY_DN11219_c0_g2_i2.p1  ORF type:complete len:109 (+),score=23.37 TRINITY_DN11219_c0_g2_i2:52-378(+)